MPRSAHAKKPRKQKYFNLHESDSSGMDNAFWVVKKRKGYYLYASEIGQVGVASQTVCDALNENQYAGGRVEIDTNIPLEELLKIMNTNAFKPLLHNTHSLTINGAKLEIESFRNIVAWHDEVSEKLDGNIRHSNMRLPRS